MKEDKYIWNEFKRNDGQALSHIYLNNIDFLFFYGKKFTSDEDLILDVIQDLFYDLIRSRKNLGETDNIRLYLLKSFRRRLLREIKNRNKTAFSDTDLNPAPEITFSIEDELITNEEQSRKADLIRKGLKELNQQQREVFYYKFTLGYDYGQICEIMSISYDSARQLVSRGINSLKRFMEGNSLFILFILRSLKKT